MVDLVGGGGSALAGSRRRPLKYVQVPVDTSTWDEAGRSSRSGQEISDRWSAGRSFSIDTPVSRKRAAGFANGRRLASES